MVRTNEGVPGRVRPARLIRHVVLLLVGAIGVAASGGLRRTERPTPEALAEALQRRYDQVRDLTASFVHTYEGGLLRRRTTERGTVVIKKPGKMRWEYTAPEPKLFVSDGRKLYSYLPADRQVFVGTMPEGDEATTAVLFLAGQGRLDRDFLASADETAPSGTYALKLVPRRPQADYTWLRLVVDADTLALKQLSARDAQGGLSVLTLTNLKENQGVSDKVFAFAIPRGVEVITGGFFHAPQRH
jgi:outer membrane lipoprotein carrier protein